MLAHHSLRPARGSSLGHLGSLSGLVILRLAAAFALALVGMSALAGWATDSSLVWFAWLGVGAVAGLAAGRASATWLVAPATLLVYAVVGLLGRSGKPIQPDPTVWMVLVLVGGIVTAAGFAAGAAAAERRVGRTLVAAILVGMIGLGGWGGYSGYVGSNEVLDAKTTWPHCDTPASMFGWGYEAMNYDPADDARLVTGKDVECSTQGTKAGTAVVTQDGIGIAGWYIPAGSGAAATAPTFIVSPGWKSNKSEALKYAPFFHQRFNLVLLDLRNQGRSGGTMTTFGFNERQDVRAVVDWLERTKQPTWIGAMGNSMGAATVLGEAAGDPRIRALVLDSMHATMLDTFADSISHERNLPGLPTSWGVVGASALRSGVDVSAVDPVKVIGTVGARPMLLIHGTADTLDTVDHAAKPNLAAAQAAGIPVTMQYCQGGTHGGLVNKCPTQWQAWLNEFLAGIPELKAAGG